MKYFAALFLVSFCTVFCLAQSPVTNAMTDNDITQTILNNANPDRELNLYDTQGNALAYVDCKDQYTIYLWDGTPVAYLYLNNNLFHIYSFNGNHLGWLVNGVVYDHDGSIVGCSKDVCPIMYQFEPMKEFKKIKPAKRMKNGEPFTPMITGLWSDLTLAIFLNQK
ncbi:MAG: 4-fold beta flower protein [Cytophagaceae bacterium]